jgi:phage antirepressor YoqD-like protein
MTKQITVEELRKLYTTMQNKDLCKKLKISNQTLVKYLRMHDIPLKGKGNYGTRTKIKIIKEVANG